MKNQSATVVRERDNGLILHRSTRAGAEALAAFNQVIHIVLIG